MNKDQIQHIIRVDHAGELGAKWIYEGQLRWIKDPVAKETIQHMYDQEIAHLNYFEDQIRSRHVRPTALMPIWKWVGRTAGAVSGWMGTQAAMACTQAVEEVIDRHYESQINYLETTHPNENQLIDTLKQFRQDECNHRDVATEHINAPSTPIKRFAKMAVKAGVRLAISLSKRV